MKVRERKEKNKTLQRDATRAYTKWSILSWSSKEWTGAYLSNSNAHCWDPWIILLAVVDPPCHTAALSDKDQRTQIPDNHSFLTPQRATVVVVQLKWREKKKSSSDHIVHIPDYKRNKALKHKCSEERHSPITSFYN